MKKNTIRLLVLAVLLIGLLAAVLCGCGDKADEQQIANPMHEATEQELLDQTGLSFAIPAEASDVTYAYFDTEPQKLAQAEYIMNGVTYTVRAQASAEAEDISGYYLDWDHTESTTVGTCDAELRYNDDGKGYVTWFDVAPGINYSFATEAGGDGAAIPALAAEVCPPVQGDAG